MTWKQWTWGLALALAATVALAPVAYGQDEPAAEAPAAETAAAEEAEPPAEAEAAPAEGEAVVEAVAAEEAPDTLDAVRTDADILWVCMAAFLVFFMQAGFALVECGFTRAKNACNIIMKNLLDFSIGGVIYWLVGFSLMFGASTTGWIAWGGESVDWVWTGKTDTPFNWAFLVFQTMFAATAATIVSGTMAERTKFSGYLVYTVFITLFIYPIFGSWTWNSSGWLFAPENGVLGSLGLPGFADFAGSTIVHSVGGWCALAGALVVGARLGKYGKDGRVNPIPGHSIPMGALGVFILWMGWFGFNPGSTVTIAGGDFARIAFNTNIAACTGCFAAMVTSWIAFKKPDPSLSLNGALAGLVGITAGCATLSPIFSAITGAVAGVLVVGAIVFFDKIRIDDPVGAVSVHGVCGVWATLATGLFHMDGGLITTGQWQQTATQLIGIAAAFLWAFPTSLILFLAVKYTIGLRVTQQEEIEGLDIGEHGMYAYPQHLVADGHATGVVPSHGASYAAEPYGKPVSAHS